MPALPGKFQEDTPAWVTRGKREPSFRGKKRALSVRPAGIRAVTCRVSIEQKSLAPVFGIEILHFSRY